MRYPIIKMTTTNVEKPQSIAEKSYGDSSNFIGHIFESLKISATIKECESICDKLNNQNIIEREELENINGKLKEINIKLIHDFKRLLLALLKRRNENIIYLEITLKEISHQDIVSSFDESYKDLEVILLKSPENKILEKRLIVVFLTDLESSSNIKFVKKNNLSRILLYIDRNIDKYRKLNIDPVESNYANISNHTGIELQSEDSENILYSIPEKDTFKILLEKIFTWISSIKSDPIKDEKYWKNEGEKYYEEEKYKDALINYEKALDDVDYEPYRKMIIIFSLLGRNEDALDIFNRIEKYPKLLDNVLYQKAIVLSKLGNNEVLEALDIFNRIEKYPKLLDTLSRDRKRN